MERASRFEAAAQAYAAVTRRQPDDAGAWAGLGRSQYAMGGLRGATVAFANASRLDPQSAALHHSLARVLIERECADQAEDEIDLALTLEKDPRQLAAYRKTETLVAAHSGPSVVCPLDY
jgi:cytochrome c-type biogenesis protein CcmH/NrfG